MPDSQIITFRCPACGVTADAYVPKGGVASDARLVSRAAGLLLRADFENPRETTCYHGCTHDETGQNTLMKKISERDA